MVIEASQKDILLQYFVKECSYGKWINRSLDDTIGPFNEMDEMKAVFLYFERMGLIECKDNQFNFMEVILKLELKLMTFTIAVVSLVKRSCLKTQWSGFFCKLKN